MESRTVNCSKFFCHSRSGKNPQLSDVSRGLQITLVIENGKVTFMQSLTRQGGRARPFLLGKNPQDLQRRIRAFLLENGHVPSNTVLSSWVKHHHLLPDLIIADGRKSSERQELTKEICAQLEELEQCHGIISQTELPPHHYEPKQNPQLELWEVVTA
jgi:hypothetical protein